MGVVKRVGMRELNQYPAAVIRRVKAGETVEITERGRPVARVVPLTSDGGVLGELIRAGRAIAPAAARGSIPLPPILGDPKVSASDEVAVARERERW
ncbi:MAG: type II toxin-antitoxin system Phd/YefM family antitoxin [Candidatus Dormibacteria bacterium]